jgi:DNA-binding MurR/RpiR family transcriptional regulator
VQHILKAIDTVQQSLYLLGTASTVGGRLHRSDGLRVADLAGGSVSPELTALESRFAKAQSSLNPSRRRLLRMILENPEDTYYLSSRELAKRYQVDAATVVRTIQVLGYRKFAEFLADLRTHFVTRITPYTVLKAASKEKRRVADRLRQNMELDLCNLRALQSTFDPARVVALAKRVKKTRRILVVGIDLAATLSWYLAYGLMTLGYAAEAPVGSTGNVQRRVRSLNSKDLLIAISFGQCLRDTVEAAQRAKMQGVPTFGITDSETTPIARVCDESCFASVTSPSFGGSYVAPMSLLGAILMACAHMQTSRALRLLRRSEEEDRMDHRWYHPIDEENEARE